MSPQLDIFAPREISADASAYPSLSSVCQSELQKGHCRFNKSYVKVAMSNTSAFSSSIFRFCLAGVIFPPAGVFAGFCDVVASSLPAAVPDDSECVGVVKKLAKVPCFLLSALDFLLGGLQEANDQEREFTRVNTRTKECLTPLTSWIHSYLVLASSETPRLLPLLHHFGRPHSCSPYPYEEARNRYATQQVVWQGPLYVVFVSAVACHPKR